MSVAVCAVERKAPPPSSARLTALCEVLSEVPKPVVSMIDEYLRRLPPSELIRELSRAISSDLTVDETSAQPSYVVPNHQIGVVTVRAFYNASQLRRVLTIEFQEEDPGQPPFTRSGIAELLQLLPSENLLNDPDTVTPALKRLMDEDDSALCVVTLSLGRAWWCTVLLAVPVGSSAAAMLSGQPDNSPIRPLLEKEPLCGLMVDKRVSLFD
jgi:hypothetical protein